MLEWGRGARIGRVGQREAKVKEKIQFGFERI